MADHPLGLSDPDFWSDPGQNADGLIDAQIDAEALGVTLDAPEVVPIDVRDTAPVAGVYIKTLRENMQIDDETQVFATCIDLESNRFVIGPCLATGKLQPNIPPPEIDPGDGFTGQFIDFDLRERFGVPWQPGRYSVSVVVRERLSNQAEIKLERSMHKFRDPEVEAYLARRNQKAAPPAAPHVWPPLPIDRGPDYPIAPYPSYRQDNDSPEIPEQPGIALSIDRVVERGDERRAMLRGSFRLPITELERVSVDPVTGLRQVVGDPEATAVVAIHLVATGADSPGPFIYPLRVPSYEPLEEGAREITGYFNLDLFELAATPGVADTYFFYAFSRDLVAGPAPMGVVPPR